MQIAPSTYYAARSRPPSARSVADEERLETIRQLHADNYGVYGSARCTPNSTVAVTTSPAARCTGSCAPTGCAGSAAPRVPAPRSPDVARTLGLICSIVTSGPLPRTRCGSRTSPTAEPSPAGLRGVRHRRLLPPCRGVASVEEPAHRLGAGRPRDGSVDPRARRPGHPRRDCAYG